MSRRQKLSDDGVITIESGVLWMDEESELPPVYPGEGIVVDPRQRNFGQHIGQRWQRTTASDGGTLSVRT